MKPSSRTSRVIKSIETEIVVQRYADRILVLVSQLGKVGNLIQASIPPTAPLLPPAVDTSQESALSVQLPPSIELTPLLGSAPNEQLATLHALYASHIATLIWSSAARAGNDGGRKNVIVGLALKQEPVGSGDFDSNEDARDTFKEVLEMIAELL